MYFHQGHLHNMTEHSELQDKIFTHHWLYWVYATVYQYIFKNILIYRRKGNTTEGIFKSLHFAQISFAQIDNI